ncbi:MAG: MalY/PatB family protein [Ilumatobacteraceae bacterium]
MFDDLSLDWLRAKPGVKWHRHGAPFAAWVADMDFPPAACITEVLRDRLDGGDVGYPDWAERGSPALDAWAVWCATHYGWSPAPGRARELNDVVQGIQTVLHLCTEPGDRVVVHTPAYPPFLHSVEDAGRRLVRVPAQGGPANGGQVNGSADWHFDHDELDARLEREPAAVLLLCHPHNPTGHVFADADLQRLADIAERHDLLIVSDEIHADLVHADRAPGGHRPMALFAPDRTVTLHAASKAFNLAGLRYAVAHIGPDRVLERFDALPDHLLGTTNLMGSLAAEAAWTSGGPWLEAVLDHIGRHRHLLADLLAAHLPQIAYAPPAATYLAWLDCRALGWGDDPAAEFARRGVRVSEGPNYGVEGHGFARLNLATSADVLRAIVDRMADGQGHHSA